MKKGLLCFVLASQLWAGENQHSKRWWYCSIGVLAAGSTADAVSSWRLGELNPVLRNSQGQFGGKAVSIKAAIGGGTVLLEWLKRRNHTALKLNTLANFGTGAMYGITAYHNEQIRRGPCVLTDTGAAFLACK
jgi:hypothetical protein